MLCCCTMVTATTASAPAVPVICADASQPSANSANSVDDTRCGTALKLDSHKDSYNAPHLTRPRSKHRRYHADYPRRVQSNQRAHASSEAGHTTASNSIASRHLLQIISRARCRHVQHPTTRPVPPIQQRKLWTPVIVDNSPPIVSRQGHGGPLAFATAKAVLHDPLPERDTLRNLGDARRYSSQDLRSHILQRRRLAVVD